MKIFLNSDLTFRLQQTHPTGPEYDSEGPGGFWARFHTADQCGEFWNNDLILYFGFCWYFDHEKSLLISILPKFCCQLLNFCFFVCSLSQSQHCPVLPLTSSVPTK